MLPYTQSRLQTIRRKTRAVNIGPVQIGGDNPLCVQSMTTTNTLDVEATVKQSIELIEAGCQIVRITAPNRKAAAALKDISKRIRKAGYDTPLVADIHFLPVAAMEAVEHVEKVRVNPGNYADRKKFDVREYTDAQYEEELQRIYEKFSPLVQRAKELGRAMRIGTNHGSLSDRIMNRYGDTPEGMVESALEFIRIAESHKFHDIVISMKASNPKVMVQAYRLAVAKMAQENMHYPLHLGVTEAGDGEDARIKSSIGIGSLLIDGLGDTIRVSLTENPVNEIPVCLELKKRVEKLWEQSAQKSQLPEDTLNPYEYERREVINVALGNDCNAGNMEPPRVIIPANKPLSQYKEIVRDLLHAHKQLRDAKVEGLLVEAAPSDTENLTELVKIIGETVTFFVVDVSQSGWSFEQFLATNFPAKAPLIFIVPPVWLEQNADQLRKDYFYTTDFSEITDAALGKLTDLPLIATTSKSNAQHAVGEYRHLAERLKKAQLPLPIWIRCADACAIATDGHFPSRLIESSVLAGSLLCDGIGDFISIEDERYITKASSLAYNILQGAKTRQTKTEYVACPSCGRTLFDLESTTARIRGKTGHLKNVTIAVMGCIVNGPGEMADADFGYVGGAPGRVNLYVGKTPVKHNIPEAEAVDRLVQLISEHGKWVEPEEA